jgi:thiamine biosynthesis lipoprotein
LEHRTGTIEVPEDCVQMFQFFEKMESLTDGQYTPCIGRALSDAGYDRSYSFIDKKEKAIIPRLSEVLRIIDTHSIELLQPFLFDFGGIAKGWCIDHIATILERHHHSSFLINGSGDVLYRGGKVLRCGLENPKDASQVIGVFSLTDGAFCASSGSKRKWGNYHHILNPKTQISPSTILATWVKAETALIADTLATCLFLVNPEILTPHFSFEYCMLFQDFSVQTSNSFDAEMFMGADNRQQTTDNRQQTQFS